jgi:hypothetical protein
MTMTYFKLFLRLFPIFSQQQLIVIGRPIYLIPSKVSLEVDFRTSIYISTKTGLLEQLVSRSLEI